MLGTTDPSESLHHVMLLGMVNEIPIQEQAPESEDLLLRLVEEKSDFLCNVQARFPFFCVGPRDAETSQLHKRAHPPDGGI